MSLGLGQMSGETLVQLSQYIGAAADNLYAQGLSFIQNLVDDLDTTFEVPAVDTLNYMSREMEIRIAYPPVPFIDMRDIAGKIDQINALSVPAVPSLSTPVVSMPVLSAGSPIISMPARPDATLTAAPTDAPNLVDVTPPDAPLVVLPNVPTFEELQLPTAPAFSIPTFSASAPQNLLSPPTNTFAYVDTGYLSSLRDPLVSKLLSDLVNGGYGIETADEQALWARARDRAEQQGKIAVTEAMRQSLGTSFPLPQGVCFANINAAKQKLQEVLSEINRDIALKRAEMYVENRKFTIQEVQKCEQMAIALYNAVQERAYNFAKDTVNIGIAIYDAGVRNFNSQLDAYKTEASVFESRIRAELSKAEIFKAQVEAEKLRGEFNQIKVNLYNAQLLGVATTVTLYKSRIEAANLLAQLQQQKLEVFKSRVSIYSETVRAKAIEFEMYKAGIAGEMAKVEIYKAEVEAYTQRVQAEEAKSRITIQGNEVLIQQYKASVSRYQAQMEGLAKTVDARLESAKTQIQGYNVDVSAYQAYVQASLESNKVLMTNQRINNEWNIAALASNVDRAKISLEQAKLVAANRVDINKFGAGYFQTMLGAVLSSLQGLSVKTAE